MTIELKNSGSEKVKILALKSDNPSLKADYSTVNEGMVYAIKVSIKKNASGIIRSRLTILTDHKDEAQQKLVLPVYAIISRNGGQSKQ